MSESSKILCFTPSSSSSLNNTAYTLNNIASCDLSNKDIVKRIIAALIENRYDPVSQLFGFLTTEDPTYLPDVDDIRVLARRIGRDKMLETLILSYLDTNRS